MRTSRDGTVWKVRVLILRDGTWAPKTLFYSREVFAKKWLARAENNPNLHIDFYGKYVLEESSVRS